MIEHGMNVDGTARHRPVVAEHFHAVDQGHDAIGLVADQPGQHAVFGGSLLFQELRRAANAGKRVLDLMGEHRGQRDHAARGAAMGELPVHLVGDGAFLQHHHDMAGALGERRDMQVDLAIATHAGGAQIDLVFIDRRMAGTHLVDQGEQRTAERHQLLQRLALQELGRDFEKGFGRHVGVDDLSIGTDQQHGIGQRVEDGFAVRRPSLAMFRGRTHAAALHAKSSKASPSA
jgi:hypothetical protein